MSENSKLVSERRRTLKKMIIEYMGGKCFRCGWDDHPAGLVPHHVDPSKKSFSLGSGNTYSWAKIEPECKKCILLCQNCHSVIHAIHDDFYFNEENIPDYGSFVDPTAIIPREQNVCIDCSSNICFTAQRCRSCAGKTNARTGNFKIAWPDIETLEAMIAESNYVQVGKQLGVSDNAVRKHIALFRRIEQRTQG